MSCTALRKNIKERKCGIFRQIFDVKSGYRELNPLCPASQRYRCFLFLADFSIPDFFRYANFCVFFYQMALVAFLPASSIALPCFRSPATPSSQKKRESACPASSFFKPLFLLLYGKTMPLPAPAAMLSAAAAFLPAIYLTCAH